MAAAQKAAWATLLAVVLTPSARALRLPVGEPEEPALEELDDVGHPVADRKVPGEAQGQGGDGRLHGGGPWNVWDGNRRIGVLLRPLAVLSTK